MSAAEDRVLALGATAVIHFTQGPSPASSDSRGSRCPPTSVSNLELLLGMAAHGVSVLDVLRAKASPSWRQRPLQHVMAHMSKGLAGVRPPVVEAAFRDVMSRATMKMFGRELPDPEQGE